MPPVWRWPAIVLGRCRSRPAGGTYRLPTWRWAAFALGAILAAVAAGCISQSPAPSSAPEPPLPSADELRQQLDDALEWTFRNRHLNLRDHAAWQILHGVLAFQRAFAVETEPGGKQLRAMEHLLGGGAMNGWTLEPGRVLDEATGRRGLRAILEQGTKTGQGHQDQWLHILAVCGYEPSQPIVVQGVRYTIADMVEQAQWDVPRNVQREYSWTVSALSAYLPSSAQWVAQDGKPWSLAELVAAETEQDLATAACGGTHRLIGLTVALSRHLAQGGRLEGAWAQADQKIKQGLADAQQYQNPDGSFSANYFRRGGKTADLAQDLGSSGHIFEFLSTALTDTQLREPWVGRAAAHLCRVFAATRDVPIECGALYHAAHGLVIYRERMYGRRTWAAG